MDWCVFPDGAKIRYVYFVSVLPAHSRVSDGQAIVIHVTQGYSACCQTWCAVRFVYWFYVLPGLLQEITESRYFTTYTSRINKPLSNKVLLPLRDSLSDKNPHGLLSFLKLTGFTRTDEVDPDNLTHFCNMSCRQI